MEGNIIICFDEISQDNWKSGVQVEIVPDTADCKYQMGTLPSVWKYMPFQREKPFLITLITIMSVEGAYEFVLENAGATLPKRDAVDERIVKEVRSGKANSNEGIITDISQVGGYLEYKGEPYHDKGKDGIPDKWEKKFGLDPNDPSDANKDLNGECILTLKSISMGLILKTK